RHFGVLMSGVATIHAYHVLNYYQNYGRLDRLEALLTFDSAFTGASLPFQLFGLAALVILIFMALSSHDFWQKVLGPAMWKWLHMSVYLAFALAVLHVAFGELQWETHPAAATLVLAAAGWVGGLHVVSAYWERDFLGSGDKPADGARWVDAGDPTTIPLDRARRLDTPSGERIALIRHGDQVSAVHGVCAHQGGPLYEGKVIDGCLTCPWHGWQYRPEDGQSPPPFTERIPTYRVKIEGGRLWVDIAPLDPGTAVEPARLEEASE
ncbi:MAG: Rieske 2Fe-2S domain-containing protein, partial [Myxococcota bacterium]